MQGNNNMSRATLSKQLQEVFYDSQHLIHLQEYCRENTVINHPQLKMVTALIGRNDWFQPRNFGSLSSNF